jgi:hypothetical protein
MAKASAAAVPDTKMKAAKTKKAATKKAGKTGKGC